jgi:hypothetical protein
MEEELHGATACDRSLGRPLVHTRSRGILPMASPELSLARIAVTVLVLHERPSLLHG